MISQMQTRPDETMGSSRSSRDFEVVLHVGHPKTASTWLQETVFANPDLGFVFPWHKDDCRSRTITAFITANSFSDDVALARGLFEEGCTCLAGGPGVPVISDESLCGDPLYRHSCSGRYLADRIHAVFPRAKILIGVREQKAIAISFYREYLFQDGVFPFDVFLGRGDEPLGFTPILHPDFLEDDCVVGYYHKIYGRENVLVLPMEMLARDREGYVRSMLEFCQCSGRIEHLSPPKRVGLSAAALEVRRWLNRLSPSNPLTPPPSTLTQRAVFKLGRVVNRLAPKSFSAPLERSWRTSSLATLYRNVPRE